MVIVPKEYGRSGRTWTGKVASKNFERLAVEVSGIDDHVTVELHFDLDAHGRTTVHGHATVCCRLPCHRCAEQIEHQIRADIEARIVHDERQASEIAPRFDVIVCDQGEVEIKTLVEDDLILSIPWKVCSDDEKCQIGEAKDYLKGEESGDRSRKPFASLRDLLSE